MQIHDTQHPEIRFDPSNQAVTIVTGGEVDVLHLYRMIREWEASVEGIAFDHILDGSGNIELPDGTRTPRVIVFVNGWSLAAEEPVAVVGGYLAGRDAAGEAVHPVSAESRDRVRLLGDETPAGESVPTEAQVRHALAQADRFREDWDIDPESRAVFRRDGASERVHRVFALYWYMKQEYLTRGSDLARFDFPIRYEDRPATNERSYTWARGWSIRSEDMRFLVDGPLVSPTDELVSATQEAEDLNSGAVTIGIVTALAKELAPVLEHMENVESVQGPSRTLYKVGRLPAAGGGTHVVAVAVSHVGNNSAAIRAANLCTDFPSLRSILMVGIAGAVPSPSKPEDHVRLGDIVVSGRGGVIQYDFSKEGEGYSEPRHLPRPPGARLLEAVAHLEAGWIRGERPWLERLKKTAGLLDAERPLESEDTLACSGDPTAFVDHPLDPHRTPGEPRLFVGNIGAANRLLKDPMQRDEIRDQFDLRAIEMEGAGIADATFDLEVAYLVIRGTCDYCDGNKDDRWQGHAAVLAAAFAVTLLAEMFPDAPV